MRQAAATRSRSTSSYSLVQTKYAKDGGIDITFGAGHDRARRPAVRRRRQGRLPSQAGSPARGKGKRRHRSRRVRLGGAAPPLALPLRQPAPHRAADAAPGRPRSSCTARAGGRSTAAQPPRPTAAEPASAPPAPTTFPPRRRSRPPRSSARSRRGNAFLDELSRRLLRRSGARLPQEARRHGGAAPPRAAGAATPAPSPQPDARAPTAAASLRPSPGKPAVARGGAVHGLSREVQPLLHRPGLEAVEDRLCEPERRRRRRDAATRRCRSQAAVAAARPGTQIYFLRGSYQGCFEFTKENSGTYDEPVVLYGERNEDKSLGVAMTCCSSGRQTCFNFEDADYIAVDGFELVGGTLRRARGRRGLSRRASTRAASR